MMHPGHSALGRNTRKDHPGHQSRGRLDILCAVLAVVSLEGVAANGESWVSVNALPTVMDYLGSNNAIAFGNLVYVVGGATAWSCDNAPICAPHATVSTTLYKYDTSTDVWTAGNSRCVHMHVCIYMHTHVHARTHARAHARTHALTGA